MKRKENLFMVMGAPSLFLIFAVLCMAILGLLSLGTSRTDLEMSRTSVEKTSLYYEACGKASDICLEIEDALADAGRAASEEGQYFNMAEEIAKKIAKETEGVSWEKELRRMVVEIKITEEQSLRAELQVLEPGSGELLRILSWKTVVSDVWEPQMHQPVYKGAKK